MSFRRQQLKQTAVYWSSPTPDGYGGFSFSDPEEIKVRWEDTTEVFIDFDGNEAVSSSVIFCESDLDKGGYLYLGDLDDLSSSEEGDPQSVTGARPIRGFAKTPDMRGRKYTRRAWL